jgi:hypothetical protein
MALATTITKVPSSARYCTMAFRIDTGLTAERLPVSDSQRP